jgi:flagellar hook-length control protein FliK
VEKGPAFAQTRPAQTPGIFIAQEVANTNAAVSRFQIGDGETGSVSNAGAGTPSGGATATPQMAGTQSGADTLPSPATAAAVDPTLGRPTGATTAPPTSASGVLGVGPGATASTASGTSPSATAAMRAPQPLPVPVDQFAVHVARAASVGTDHISIKLKPASLGQVEVKLEVTHDGRIAAVITAERSETLDMLQRDARALERALQEAGLKTDANSLQFNLRGENGSGHGFNDMNSPAAAAESADAGDILETAAELVAGIYQNSRASVGGVDIRV